MLTSITLPALSWADEIWLRRIIEEDQARLFELQAAWDTYYGENQETLKPSKSEQGKVRISPDNVVLNFAQFVVDTSAFFLFGEDLRFDLGTDKSPTERTPDEQYLDGFWAANRKMTLLQKIGINGGVAGHVFVKLEPPRPGEQYPRLINLSPEYVHVACEPDDIDRVRRYIIQYPAIDPDKGDRLVRRQIVERTAAGRWTIRDQESRNDGRFVSLGEALWPWPWAPIIDCQNLPTPNEYYGRSDIQEHVVKLQRSLNFVMSNLQRIIRYHAHPKTWGQGFKKEDLRVAVDETIVLPKDASLQNVEMLTDLTSSVELYLRLKEALHQITQTPEVAAGKLESAGSVSGVALQILYGPLISKTAVKRSLYGALIQEIHRRVLEMGGRDATKQTTIHWPNALPGDPLVQRQTALIDKQLGVSDDTLLQQLGYDPDAEREKRETNMMDMADTMLQAFDRGDSGDPAQAGQRNGAQPEANDAEQNPARR